MLKKRGTVLCLTILVSAVAFCQQKGYRINGTIEGWTAGIAKNDDHHVYLYGAITNGKGLIDSALIVDGKFQFKGYTDEPCKVSLVKNNHGFLYVDLFLENSEIEIKGKYEPGFRLNRHGMNVQNVVDLKVEGSKTQEEYQKLLEYASAESSQGQSSNELSSEERKERNERYNTIIRNYAEENPSSYVGLYLLSTSNIKRMSREDLQDIERRFGQLDVERQTSFAGRQLKKEIDEHWKRLAIQVGSMAIDIAQPDSSGNIIQLSDFKGKYVLLDFWASWCGPCRAEFLHLKKVYEQYHDKGLEILAVSTDTDRKSWLKAIADDQLPWIQVSDLKKPNAASAAYFVSYIPDNFLIDPDGRVIALKLRGHELELKLAEIFKDK